MSTVSVRVDADFDLHADVNDQVRIIGAIWATDPDRPSRRDITLPVGRNVEAATFELADGRYVVQASLPSGRVISARIEPTHDHQDVVIHGSDEGDWTYLDVEQVTAASLPQAWMRSIGTVVRTIKDAPAELIERSTWLRRQRATHHDDTDSGTVVGYAWTDPESAPTYRELLELAHADFRPVSTAKQLHMHYSRLGNVGDDSHLTPTLKPLSYEHTTDLTHPWNCRYIIAESETQRIISVLPVPWITQPADGQPTIEPGVTLTVEDDDPYPEIAVTPADVAVRTAAQYFRTNQPAAAVDLLRSVIAESDALTRRPFAFIYASFVILEVDPAWMLERDLVAELLKTWRHLSDAHILAGALKLAAPETHDDIAYGRQHLLDAFELGLPTCTLGLRWLLDGLQQFPDDKPCSAAHAQVLDLTTHLDTSRLFTTLRLHGHN